MPQNTSLSLLGTPALGMTSRCHPTYGSGMYRPEDNAYVQHYSSQLDLNSLYRNGEYLNINNYLVLHNASLVYGGGTYTTSKHFTGVFMNEPGTYLFFVDKGRRGTTEPFAEGSTPVEGRIHRVTMRNDEALSNTSDYISVRSQSVFDYTGYYPHLYISPSVVKWTEDGTRIFISGDVWAQADAGYPLRSYTKYWNHTILSAKVTNDVNGNPRVYSLDDLSNINGAIGWDAFWTEGEDVNGNKYYNYSNVNHGNSLQGSLVDFQVTPDGTKLIYLYHDYYSSGPLPQTSDAYLTELEFTGNPFEFSSTFGRPQFNQYSNPQWINAFDNSNTDMQWTNVSKTLSVTGTPAASLTTKERGRFIGFNFTHNGKKIQAHTDMSWMFTYDLTTAYDLSTMSTTPSGHRYFNTYVGNSTDRNDGDQNYYSAQFSSSKFNRNTAGVCFYNNQRSMIMSLGDGEVDWGDNYLRDSDDFGQLNVYFYGVPRF
jgi:hypothetical protein